MLRVVYSKHCNNYKRRAKSSSEKFKEEFIMRKKLLALLMCATMVLGSSAVAFAAPSQDDYTNAKKIYDNSKNFTNELYKENEKVKETVWVKSVQSNVTFGFDAETLQAVKLNDDSKALLYVGDAADVTAAGTVNASTTIGTVVEAYAASKNLDTAKTVADLGLNKVIYAAKDNMGLSHVIYASVDNAAVAPAAATYTTVKELTAKDITFNGAKQTVYYTADGYSFVESGAKLFEADVKDVTGSGIKCVKYDTAKLESKYIPTLAKALENGTLTKNAIAVQLTAYSVVGDKDVYGDFRLNKVTTPTAGYTVTSLSDLLSRTSLKNSVNIYKFNEESPVTDYEMGASIYPISTVATDVAISDTKFTFDVTFTGDSDVIIFDQAGDASNNDGVADTTTAAAANNRSSPKTGDVAPIAALAVVMMGACGAMVVASKKRA